jgi:hypothetical protein
MRQTKQKGTIILQVLLFSTIAIFMLSGIVSWGVANVKSARQSEYREEAVQVAESGIDYYRWHLAHASTDYQDGRATTGPYVHELLNKDANVLGSYKLNIIPPPFGSTIVTVRSTGTTSSTPPLSRTIEARLAIPSLAKYAVVANADMRFGVGTEIFGPVHSNGGVRLDGLAHNVVTSARSDYDDPDHNGGNEFAVHTHVDAPPGSGTTDTFRAAEAPPSAVPSRADVFEVGRTFPVPTVDFAGLTSDLASMKATAQASGYYYSGSGAQGYHIVLKTNDTYDIYRVNTLVSTGGGCTNSLGESGWGSWSIASTTGGAQTLIENKAFPADGVIFVEDHVWVDGQINTARLTIASGRFPDSPATRTTITVNSNLLYSNYDGQDVISLIAQNNINLGLHSSDTIRIDAALVAQNGRVGRYYYPTGCTTYYKRNTVTLYGMIATNQRYGFSFTGSNNFLCSDGTWRASGYCTRNITYDANLLYGPPPSFPLTSSQYQVISWQEIKNP